MHADVLTALGFEWPFVAVFAIPIGVGALFVFIVRRIMAAQKAQATPGPISSRSVAGRRSGGRFLEYFLFGMFAVIGSVLLVVILVLPLANVFRARSWVSVPCVVESSAVRSHSDSDGTTYRPVIVYTYRYADADFRSDRYDFMAGSSSGRSGKQAIVDRYRPGLRTNCWVNPNRPADAVLHRGLVGTMAVGAIPLVFVGIGVGGLVYTIRGRRRTAAAAVSAPAAGAPLDAGESRELKPEHSRLTRAGLALGVAAFWNGITWTIFFGAVRGGSWFEVAFFSVFLAIGAVLALAAAFAWLALANPRPYLTLRPGRLRHGPPQSLSWRFSGAVARLRRLTISLVGREVATYTRGTDRVTERALFAREVVFDSESPSAFRDGEAAIVLPSPAPPGFAGDHNRVEWTLRVRGVIAFWPDVDEEFPVEVDGGLPTGSSPPDTVAAADAMTRSDDGALALGTEAGRGAFLPGETLQGAAGWSLAEPPESAEVRLFWYTRGKGTRDLRVVSTVPFPDPGAQEVRPFSVNLPDAPWSTDGRLVSLGWALELVVEPGARNVLRELVLSPTSQPVNIAESIPEEPAGTPWQRWWRDLRSRQG